MIAVSWIMDYEAGELDHEQIVAGFQTMIDDGTVWQLQGSYGRMACDLIAAGLCQRPEPSEGQPQWRKRSRKRIKTG